MAQMTKEVLVEACKKNGGYAQPRLNDQLFLQYRGFSKIENLEPYTDLKVLWLEQNAIDTIEGVETLEKLVSLFIQNNALRRISGLDHLQNLRILNVSNNFLTKLENLRCCPLLETLQASHCRLSSLEDLEEVKHLPELSALDVSFNKIERRTDEDRQDTFLVDFFKEVPSLSVLYLHGNEVVRTLKDYRKNMIVGLPNLAYLDERPVFPDERRVTEAWGQGGREAEDAEREKIREEKRAHVSSCVEDMIKLKERTKDQRDAREKEWRELQERRQKWEEDHHLTCVREITEMDHEEFEARSLFSLEEEKEWLEVAAVAGEGLDQVAIDNEQAIAEAKVRAAAEEELRQQEMVMESKRKQERLTREEEMRFWVKKFSEEDALLEDQLQGDLDKFLAQLTPGASEGEMLGMPQQPQRSPQKHHQQRAIDVPAPVSAVSVPTTAGPSRTTAAKKAVGSKQKKTDIWEKYYAMETAAARKFASKSTSAA